MPRWACNLVLLILPVITFAQDGDQDKDGQDTTDQGHTPIIDLPAEPPKSDYWDRVWKYWNESVFDQVRISGFRNLGYHITDISGDDEAYALGTYGGQGGQRFTDIGFLRFTGNKVFGTIDFEANIQDSRFQDPQAQRYKIKYTNGPWEAETGDIFTVLPSNNVFARLGKQLTGTTAAYTSGPLAVKVVTSEARGQARTVTIQGTNSAGPYYLQSSQIIRGSESIQIDGVEQVFGEDYTIDYELGSVTFVNRATLQAKIVPPTSTIVATYESFGFNGSAGKIQGAGARIELGSAGRIGLTAIQQKSGGSGRLSSRLEKFQGFGAPSTPYFLQFEPLDTQPIIIRVDGILQTEGVDYYFDPNNASIFYFNRFMPATSDIDVVYTPKPTTDIQGDRETYGIDYTVGFSKDRGRFNFSTAIGKLTNSAAPRDGRAQQAGLSFGTPKFNVNATVRDVPDDYVSVESTSFNRNEKSNRLNATYRPSNNSTIELSQFNSSIATRSTSSTDPIRRTRFTSTTGTYNLTPQSESSWPLTFEVSRTNTENSNQSSRVDTTALRTNKSFGKLSTQFSLQNQSVTGTQRADLLSAVTRLAYVPSRVWTFGAEASVSDIRTPDDKGTGTDYTLTAAYRPNDRFNIRASYNENNAGSLTDLSGYSSGFGSGYGGNGFTSGAVSSTTNAASSGRYAQLAFDWLASDRISLDGAFSIYRRTGNISSNSETKAATVGGTIDLGKGHIARGSLSRSETNFIDSPLSSTATTFDFQLAGSPPGRFSYSITATALLSGGSSEFQQDAFNYDLSLDYRLADRHQLGFNINTGTIRGYYPQDELDTSLTYRYQIWESLAFNASYRVRDVKNLDPLLSSGAYRATGLHFTLAFNFFR